MKLKNLEKFYADGSAHHGSHPILTPQSMPLLIQFFQQNTQLTSQLEIYYFPSESEKRQIIGYNTRYGIDSLKCIEIEERFGKVPIWPRSAIREVQRAVGNTTITIRGHPNESRVESKVTFKIPGDKEPTYDRCCRRILECCTIL